jgi:hypothetical protein
MISQYFTGGIMPESTNPVQQGVTLIEIRPFKGGWQCYEGSRCPTLLDRRHGERGRNRLRHCARKIRTRQNSR